MKNTHRQPNPLTRKPPKAGPIIAPVPTTLLWEPKALPRSLPGNTDMTMAAPLAWIIADPAPWITFARIKISRSLAVLANAAAAMNTANPVM